MYTYGMEELISRLLEIGFSSDTCENIQSRFAGDDDGLLRYVNYCVALFGKQKGGQDV